MSALAGCAQRRRSTKRSSGFLDFAKRSGNRAVENISSEGIDIRSEVWNNEDWRLFDE